jgi:hypothetical protein
LVSGLLADIPETMLRGFYWNNILGTLEDIVLALVKLYCSVWFILSSWGVCLGNIYLEFAMSHLSLAYTFSSNIKPALALYC